MRRPLQITLLLALANLLPSALAAASLSGTVTNGTSHRPSAGDAVILISLQQRMQEAARTTTDARGHYTLSVPDDGMHLVRVDHQKASYFQPAPPGTSDVDVTVYDVAAKVPGISTEADVMRLETDPQGRLRVTQSYFVKNESAPPRTQFSSRSYEIYLPENAQIEGAAAMGPGGMPVASSPVPLGDPGHYAYLFPLRPGETQFQVTYTLPYSGSARINPRLAEKADNVVVMLPKSMAFAPAESAPYRAIDDDLNAQTFVAKNVKPTSELGFSVSGTGALPRDIQSGQSGQSGPQGGASAAQPAAQDNRPGGGLGTPLDTPDPLHKYKWWILSGVGLLLVIGAALFLRRPAQRDHEEERGPSGSLASIPPPPPPPPAAATVSPVAPAAAPPADPADHRQILLNALKEELFALETDRARGTVGEVEYAAQKQALETVIRRALNR